VSLAVLAVMTALVVLRATVALDIAVTQALQSFASLPLDVLANANTLVGQAVITSAIAAFLGYVAWRRGPPLAWLGVSLFVVVGAVGLALKLALVHPPPTAENLRRLWDLLDLTFATPSGFPSGHIARVTFLAVFAGALVRTTAARIALAVLVVYTFWARVYIGDHWVSDAVGGLALGVATGCLAVVWLNWCRARDVRGSIDRYLGRWP
jgi:membrane-associated phospholipid phosphatase